MSKAKRPEPVTDDPGQTYYGSIVLDRERQLRFDAGAWIRLKKIAGVNVLSSAFPQWLNSIATVGRDPDNAERILSYDVDMERLLQFAFVAILHEETNGYRKPETVTLEQLAGYITSSEQAFAIYSALMAAKRETDAEDEKRRPLAHAAAAASSI